MTEAIGGDDQIGRGHPEDVLDLFGPVGVDDRHHDGAQVGGGPEGDAGLDPVGQLHHHDVARTEAPDPQ